MADVLEEVIVPVEILPVEPGNFAVLTVGVVVSLLRVQKLVAGEEHRRAAAHQENCHGVPAHFPPERADIRVVGRAFRSAVPAPVVVGPVEVFPAVALVVLPAVAVHVPKREAVVAVEKVHRRVPAAESRIVEIPGARDPGGRG